MPSLNVLMVTLSFSPGSVSPYPGVNRYSISLAEALQARGCHIRVVTPLFKNTASRETWNGIEIARLPDTKTVFGSLGVLAEMNFVSFELNLLRHPELFEDCQVLQSDIPLTRFRRSWGTRPYVALVHHTYRIWTGLDVLTTPFGRLYQRRALRQADAVVVHSSSAGKDVADSYGVPRDRIQVIHPGVDTDFFHPCESRSEMADHRGPSLVYVGLLEPRKGVHDLLPMFSIVSKALPDARLSVIGVGPEEEAMKAACRREGLSDRVAFEGKVSENRLLAVLKTADVFVFPSQQEGFGLACAEAMACGKPVVAYRNPVSEEVIGEGGVLVANRDLGAFADAVIRLAANPVEATGLGENGRLRVMNSFSWDVAAAEYIRLYESLVGVMSTQLEDI